jgi:hypothetical protein
MNRLALLFALASTLPVFTCAQKIEPRDTIPTNRLDSIPGPDAEAILIESYAARFDPQKALLFSAILPGAGQVYNKQYWKVPIIYGGFVVLGIGMSELHQNYMLFKDMLFNVLNEPNVPVIIDQTTGLTSLGNFVRGGTIVSSKYGLTTEQLRAQVNKWHRDRDFTIMLTGVWYVLQVVEAHVGAHLKEFDVNPQLKVSIEPTFRNNMMTGRSSGVALTLKF